MSRERICRDVYFLGGTVVPTASSSGPWGGGRGGGAGLPRGQHSCAQKMRISRNDGAARIYEPTEK